VARISHLDIRLTEVCIDEVRFETGRFVARLNRKKIGKDGLVPGWSTGFQGEVEAWVEREEIDLQCQVSAGNFESWAID
jgi:hypothetical protein